MSLQREKRSGRATGVKDGSAGVGLAVLAAVVLVALAAAWLWLRAPDEIGSTGPRSSLPAPGASDRPADLASADAGRAPREGIAIGVDARLPEDRNRFRGRGRIRGELTLDGVEMPERWALVLEPSPTLVGAEGAARRRIEFEQGETRFEADDLPLGGYRLHADMAALNSSRVDTLLARGSSDVFVTLRIARAGLVDGFVFDHAGRPAEGLEVTLESARTRARTTVKVDATGAFLLSGVVDGEYQIHFGVPDSPLVPPGNLKFRAPTLRWRETRLPPTGAARIEVRDARGAAILDAEIVGSGLPKGVLRGRTDADGALLARFLLPARYEVRAIAPDGRAGRASFEVGVEPDVVSVNLIVE